MLQYQVRGKELISVIINGSSMAYRRFRLIRCAELVYFASRQNSGHGSWLCSSLFVAILPSREFRADVYWIDRCWCL